MTAAVKPRMYECDRCRTRRPALSMIRSRTTGARYCADLEGCSRRAARKKKAER